MPQCTVYIRKEDLTKWRALENKAQVISTMLNGTVLPSNFPMAKNVPQIIKTPKDATEAIKKVFPEAKVIEKECPRHHVPVSLCSYKH